MNVDNIYMEPPRGLYNKHTFGDCIQAQRAFLSFGFNLALAFEKKKAQRAWQRSTFPMHELCGLRTGNYDSFRWKSSLL